MKVDPRFHYGIGTSHTFCGVLVVERYVFETHEKECVTCKTCLKGLGARKKERIPRYVSG
jgi:hypothetical protein